jgi:hypothetical protein
MHADLRGFLTIVLVKIYHPLKCKILTRLELVSKELNHLVDILQHYAGVFEIYEVKNNIYHYVSKRKGKYFYTFNHFYSEKSSKRAK